MGGLTFWLVSSLLFGAVACISWLLLRSRPTDQSAIATFAECRRLRIISVTRSYNLFRYWLRGFGVSNTVRSYIVAVEDSEGARSDIHLAFDSLFGHGQMEVLQPPGLALAPPGRSANLTQLYLRANRLSWTWYERLILFGVGAGISGFIFSGILHGNLLPLNRPAFPEPAMGYTHLFKTKYGNVYGTYFEYLAVIYGVWVTWGFAAVCGIVCYVLKIQYKSRTYLRQVAGAAVISMVAYWAIWQACIYGARF